MEILYKMRWLMVFIECKGVAINDLLKKKNLTKILTLS